MPNCSHRIISKQDLVRMIDRVLMFYVRTADRLQRTSTWRENLEGGLDYLKDVLKKTAWACAPSWSRRCSKWWTPTSANGKPR